MTLSPERTAPIGLDGPCSGNPTLLHNMSCRPDAHVNHTGTHHGRAVRFALALPSQPPPQITDVLPAMGLPRARANHVQAHLERLAATPCASLARLPPVAAVHATAAGEQVPGLTDDPLLVLAVLTRCHGVLFLRDRPPCVTAERLLRAVTLIGPRNWNPTS